MKFSAVSVLALAGFAAAEVTVYSTKQVTITDCEDHLCTKTSSAPVYANTSVPTKNVTVSPTANITTPTQSAPATGAANVLAGSIAGAAVMVAAVLAL